MNHNIKKQNLKAKDMIILLFTYFRRFHIMELANS